MTGYIFPDSLLPLRNYLRTKGFEGESVRSSRQAAFVAQQLLGTRIKFPPQGSDMTSTLLLIQQQLPDRKPIAVNPQANSDLFGKTPPKTGKKAKQAKKAKPRPDYLAGFDPVAAVSGHHVYADGACVPNPGPGGWGVVAYQDGAEIFSDHGGAPAATNNIMELTAVLNAITWATQYPTLPVSIWSDSQYVVNGVNDWRHGWKAKGWQRGGDNAKPENRVLLNADLWQAIDAALSGPRAGNISVRWVKGHAGHLGNERADELAEMGRQLSTASGRFPDDLDAEFRAVVQGG